MIILLCLSKNFKRKTSLEHFTKCSICKNETEKRTNSNISHFPSSNSMCFYLSGFTANLLLFCSLFCFYCWFNCFIHSPVLMISCQFLLRFFFLSKNNKVSYYIQQSLFYCTSLLTKFQFLLTLFLVFLH